MRGKRKRVQAACSESLRYQKRQKTVSENSSGLVAPHTVQHPTLRLYYSHVYTLRDYLLSRLPTSTSKARSRRLATVGLEANKLAASQNHDGSENPIVPKESKQQLATLLDKTLVCLNDNPSTLRLESAETDFIAFSQQSCLSPGSSFEKGTTPQSEVSVCTPPMGSNLFLRRKLCDNASTTELLIRLQFKYAD